MDGHGMLLVMTTLPDAGTAREVAHALVGQRLAACVSIQADCTSVYRWEGVVEQGQETPVLIKTTVDRYPALESELRRLHPYRLPEIVAIPVVHGLAGYLEWVRSETIADDGANKTLNSMSLAG